MSIIDGVNGVNAQTITSGLSKAANEENEDTSIFDTGVIGTVKNIAENSADIADSISEKLDARKQEREDGLAEAKEHFSNGEILQGLADGYKAVFVKGSGAEFIGDAVEGIQNKLDEES